MYEEAKTEARKNADTHCFNQSGDSSCRCSGGSFSTQSSDCDTVLDSETHTYTCEWAVTVSYAGGTCDLDP
jgi:hypothetical protein